MNNIKYSWMFIAGLLMFSACTSFVEDINEDPNNATNVPLSAVLNAAMTSIIIAHEGEDARLACMWSRQFTGSDRQYSAYNVYNLNAEDFEWDKYYIAIENSQAALALAEESSDKLAQAVCKIIRAHSMSTVAALWGDCPFTQANRFPEFTDPVFDSQEDVYASCQGLISEALMLLEDNPTSPTMDAIDHFYGGSAAGWQKAAYSVSARIHLHRGHYALALETGANGILNPADSWTNPHTAGAYEQDMNVWYSFGQVDREGYLTANGAYLPSILDPASADYRGNAKTDEAERFANIFTGTAPDWDLNYTGMWTATSTYPMFSAKETHLILAESSFATNDMAGAITHLNHVRQILATEYPGGTYDDYEMADFEAGGAANPDGLSTADALIREIAEEKYISLVGQIEVFNDLRRWDNILGIPATSGGAIPERFLIPQDEVDANSSVPSPLPDLFMPTPVNM